MIPELIEDDEFDKKYTEEVLPSFMALCESKFTIPPWAEECFWDNMKNLKYSKRFIEECFSYILSNVPQKDRDLSPEIKNLLFLIMHISVSYHRALPSEGNWKETGEKLLSCGNNEITKIIEPALQLFQSPIENTQDFFNAIVKAKCTELIPACFFHFISLIHMIHINETHQWMFYPNLIACLTSLTPPRIVIMLLHFFNIGISAFPGMATSKIETSFSTLDERIGNSEPISSIVYECRNLAKKELEYPGYGFYRLMKHVSRIAPATNNVVTIFFDQNFRYFPNMMYNREPSRYSIAKSYIDLASFFIKKTLQANHNLLMTDLLKVFKMLKFNEESSQKIMKKFKLTKSDTPISDTEIVQPLPPEIPLSITKIPLTFELTTDLLVPFNNTQFMFSSVMQKVFSTAIIPPLDKYISEISAEDTTTNFEHQIIVAGNDHFFSTVLLFNILAAISSPNTFKKAFLTYFLFPLDREKPTTLMSNFLGSIDPIYSLLVKNVFHNVSHVAPTFDENSSVGFASVQEANPQFDNHVWFSNPSPSAMLQFSIQHFLMFAKKHINVRVWKCIISIDDKEIVVPFVTVLHIGLMKDKLMPSPEAKAKSYDIESKNINNVKSDLTKVKMFTASLWNVNSALNVDPRDDTLLKEFCFINYSPYKRMEKPRQYDIEVIKEINIASHKGHFTFNVQIDRREYGPTKKIRVEQMEDPQCPRQQMVVRVACFAPTAAKNENDMYNVT